MAPGVDVLAGGMNVEKDGVTVLEGGVTIEEGSVELCVATDEVTCANVVLDGNAATCTDAGACTYTPSNSDDFNMSDLGVLDLAYSFGVGPPRPEAATHLFFHSVNNKGSLIAAVNFSDCMVLIPEPEPEPEYGPMCSVCNIRVRSLLQMADDRNMVQLAPPTCAASAVPTV